MYSDLALTASGRVRSVRILSSKLVFLDIERDTQRLQIMVELKKLTPQDGTEDSYKSFKRTTRLGDWICKYDNLVHDCISDNPSRPWESHADLKRPIVSCRP
jgi:lysyl-tRNA synthetase class II